MAHDRAKSRIIVLGNLKNRLWAKIEKYAPVLQYSSLRILTSMATNNFRLLGQGNCNNSFCNTNLLDNETAIRKPPISWPFRQPDKLWLLKKTLYGIQHSPRHGFDNLTNTLKMGLKAYPHDPCMYMVSLTHGVTPICIGLYVNKFVLFSESDAVEEQFRTPLSSTLQFNWQGDADWFLGTYFTLLQKSRRPLRPSVPVGIHQTYLWKLWYR